MRTRRYRTAHWYIAATAGSLPAFVLLSFALTHGLGNGVAYGVCATAGVGLTPVGSPPADHFGRLRSRSSAISTYMVAAPSRRTKTLADGACPANPFTRVMALGTGHIATGVILIETGGHCRHVAAQ